MRQGFKEISGREWGAGTPDWIKFKSVNKLRHNIRTDFPDLIRDPAWR